MNKALGLYTLIRKHKIKNLASLLLKNKGTFILDNSFVLKYSKETKNDISQVYSLSVEHGVEFSTKEGFWNFDSINNLVITPNGIKFKLQGFDALIFSETFLYDIHYSENLKNKIVIQAGGFIGDTALYYSEKGAKVYSFEPDPNSYKLALENIKLNPQLSDNIVMRNYALGKDEFIDFPVNENGSAGSSAFDVGKNKTVKVKSISITKILEEFNIDDPYLLDLDIKGKEFEAINESSLSRFHKVRIEYAPNLASVVNGRDLLINRLIEYGFTSTRVFKHNTGYYDLHDHGTIECSKL